jgi:hypothetical protein
VASTLVVGSRDRWIAESRVDAERHRLAGSAFPIRLVRFEGGHRLDDATLATLAAGVQPVSAFP